jgi:hypothetical protein
MSLADLTATYHERQYRAKTARGESRRQARKDLAAIAAEFQSRGIPLPEPERPRRRARGVAEGRAK